MKIEKLTKIKTDYYETSPDSFQLMEKINEIIDVVNNITEQPKEEAEIVGMEDPVLQRLDKILDVLMEIKINTVLREPYITSDPPQPIQPWYGTETVTCGEQASTETTTNALDDERPKTTM